MADVSPLEFLRTVYQNESVVNTGGDFGSCSR